MYARMITLPFPRMQVLFRSTVIVSALLLGLAGSAAAQDDDAPDAETTAAARSLFDEGMAAVDAGRFQEATDLLSRSIELRDSAVTRTNLALALVELGHLVAATEHLRTAIRMSEPSSRVWELASSYLRDLEPRLGQIRISVEGSPEGTEVRLDDQPVPEALVGVYQPVDPGRHTIALFRGDERLSDQQVQIVSGRRSSVTLVASAPTPEQLAAAEGAGGGASRGTGDDGGGSVAEEAWFWILIGVLVLGAGAGITAAVLLTSGGEPEYQLGDSGLAHGTLLEVRF